MLKKVQVPVTAIAGIVYRIGALKVGAGESASFLEVNVYNQLLLFSVKFDSVDIPGSSNAEGCGKEFFFHNERSVN